MKHLFLNLLVLAAWLPVSAEERTINIEGGSTSSSYATYSDYIWLPEEDIVNVKMPRYCYFNPTIDGNGVLNLYAGGERCYLGTKNSWPNWWGFSGDIHIFPFKDNFPSAGYFGVVMSHGGESENSTYLIHVMLPTGDVITYQEVYVSELEECDAIIGMDIINLGHFHLDLCQGETTFTFSLPND